MSVPVKILLITHKFYPDVGGTEANAEFLASAFCNYGAAVHVLTWTKDKGEAQFPFKVIRDPGKMQLINEHLWADVVFENSPVLRLSWPIVFTRKPLVASLNTWLTTEGSPPSLQAKFKMQWLKGAAAVIAVSNALRAECWPNAIVIENAYNNELFVVKKPYQERDENFVFLGRLVSDKGANLAIEAISILRKKYSHDNGKLKKIKLTLIGDGADRGKLEKQAQHLGIADNVFFLGSLTGQALVDCLNQFKYMLIPSVWKEPFGIVALEGLACGCIPIVADGGGLPDAVGNAGLVFKRGDVNDLVDTVNCLLDDKSKEDGLRNNALLQLELHAPTVVARRYYDILLSTLNKEK